MHKRVRKHSALLLLMAPVIAIGSSFLVAGSANATVKTAKNVKPTITVCDSVHASFHFTVNGKLFSLGKECAAVTARAGVNHVVEVWAPASYRNVESVTVSPSAARVSASAETASATVRLSAHGAATVRFVNAKVVTEVINRTTGKATDGTGQIEVCKGAADNYVVGDFTFTISPTPTGTATVTVPVGQCSGDVTVEAGTVTVTEAAAFPYSVLGASTVPPETLGSVTATVGGGASLTVSAGAYVTLNIEDETLLGGYKICKSLDSNQGSLAGTSFEFDTSWTFQPPTEADTTANAINSAKDIEVWVTAQPMGTSPAPCSGYVLAPRGAVVTANEGSLVPDVVVSSVPAISGNASSNASSGTTAVFGVPNDGSIATATFSNEPMGFIEVCKNYLSVDGLDYNANNQATFSVNGGPSFTVNGGQCSAPMEVPAGTATVDETIGNNFQIFKISTQSATDLFGTRLQTGAQVNPATVTVPYGGVGNETVVTFWNVVEPTQFKICKQETSADANLVGDTFNFVYYYSVNGEVTEGTVALTIAPITSTNLTGLVCSGLIWGPPVVDASGDNIPILVGEAATTNPAGVEVTAISYQGNGWIVPDSETSLPSTDGALLCIDPGAGINIVTFTNGRTPYTP